MAGIIKRFKEYFTEGEFDEAEETAEFAEKTEVSERPRLVVDNGSVPAFRFSIFAPKSFEDIDCVAEALRKNKAVLVNLEFVSREEQRRICDFMNGACYVLNGDVVRVSAVTMLYVADGVGIDKELYAVNLPEYMKAQ